MDLTVLIRQKERSLQPNKEKNNIMDGEISQNQNVLETKLVNELKPTFKPKFQRIENEEEKNKNSNSCYNKETNSSISHDSFVLDSLKN